LISSKFSSKSKNVSWVNGNYEHHMNDEGNAHFISGKFHNNSADQIAALQNEGFVMIRKASTQALDEMKILNEEVIDYFEKYRSSIYYKTWRFFNKVDASTKRHSIPLQLTPVLRKVLDNSLRSISPLLHHFLSPIAPLVELSAMISFPGAKRQKVHADVPYSKDNFILSGFIALSPGEKDSCLEFCEYIRS
jgi:hypothetical protein